MMMMMMMMMIMINTWLHWLVSESSRVYKLT